MSFLRLSLSRRVTISNACFPSVYGDDLEDVIKDETRGDFTTALLALLKANKEENPEVDMTRAQKDAEVKLDSATFQKNMHGRLRMEHSKCSRGVIASVKWRLSVCVCVM